VTAWRNAFRTARITIDPNGAGHWKRPFDCAATRSMCWHTWKILAVRKRLFRSRSNGRIPKGDRAPDRHQHDLTDWRQMGHTIQLHSVDIPLAIRTSGHAGSIRVHRCAMNGADLGLATPTTILIFRWRCLPMSERAPGKIAH